MENPRTVAAKKIEYTKHARDRMYERKVNDSDVESVIESREVVTPGKEGKINLWKTINGRRLRVTIFESDTKIKVITVARPDEET